MCKHAAEDSLIFTLVLGTLILAVVSPERVPISSIKTFDCYFSYEILTTPNMILLPLVACSSHSLEKSIPFKIFNILPLISTLLGGDPIHQQTGGHMTGDCLLSSS